MNNFNKYFHNLNNLTDSEFYLFKKDYIFIVRKLIFKAKTYLNNLNVYKNNCYVSENDIDEIIENSFLYFYTKYNEYDKKYKPTTFLYYIIRNFIINELRKHYKGFNVLENSDDNFSEEDILNKYFYENNYFYEIELKDFNSKVIINELKKDLYGKNLNEFNELFELFENDLDKKLINKKLIKFKKYINEGFDKNKLEILKNNYK